MVKQAYTPLQLAQRFIDQREIQNVMGKYALMTMICKQADITDKLWAKQAPKPTLAKNDGWYVGLEAIRGYYQAVADNLAAKAKVLKTIFPKQLGDKSDAEAFGAGEHLSLIHISMGSHSTPFSCSGKVVRAKSRALRKKASRI